MNVYAVTLKSDDGPVRRILQASTKESAIEIVCRLELAPKSAVTKVSNLSASAFARLQEETNR